MAETTITERVLDTLVSAGLLTSEQLGTVREAAASGSSAGRVLVDRGLVTPADVGTALEDEMGVPRVDLSSYAPDDDALALVPAAVARARRVLPLFEIDGTLTVAVGDPMDVFELDEVATEIGAELDPVLTDSASLLGAIVQYYGEAGAEEAVAPAPEQPAASAPEPAPVPEPVAATPAEAPEIVETPQVPIAPAEAPEPDMVAEAASVPSETIEEMASAEAPSGPASVDLDILAVADSTKVAILVTDILADAAARGATRIHLLPYKDDFFLVYRVRGKLEKIASAPLSMQGALVEGFKSFGKMGTVPAGVPGLGRVRSHLGEQDLVLTISVVPTIAGQRLVVALAPYRPQPRDLAALGMNEAEVRALHAMIERGRGILLVAAPVAEGRSATYYALLAHAASSGKTAYSVERSVEYEIPAVAQVLVTPASPVDAAAYLAVGMRQDTDILAIDPLQGVLDIHLAVEAAGAGRLVICTVAAGDIVSAVRRMLDMGAEPNSLASALTLAVGQRLVRTNCPKCLAEKPSAVADKIPGAPKGLVSKAGAGCPNCNNTGYAGVTGIFEVLPFTDPVRAGVARSLPADQLTKVAAAAGMRPLYASGLAKVEEGVVSADELNRVLRFA
jgi:type IV pilus assembly protein PilB